MASPQQNKIIIVLSAVLAAVVVMSVIVLVWLPGTESPTPSETAPETAITQRPASTAPSTAPSASATFNLSNLQSPEYQQLNKQLVQEGALPVQPPPAVGKANPFL